MQTQKTMEEFEKTLNEQQSSLDESLELAFKNSQLEVDKLIQAEQTAAQLKKGFENMLDVYV